MNKRVPLVLSLVGLILLAASLAYWILQLYQPPQRPLAAAPHSAMPEPDINAAGTLFGGQAAVASATNYQLTGIVSAGRDSVAIIVAEGTPPKALKLGKELSPGIKLAEVHPRYVMLSDGGTMKRIDLATDAKAGAPGVNPGGNPGAMTAPVQPAPQTPAGEAGPVLGAAIPSGAAPAENNVPEPPMSPGVVSQQLPGSGQIGPSGQGPAQANTPAPPVQMAAPTRSTATPGQASPNR